MFGSQDWSQDSQSADHVARDVLAAPRGISPKRKRRPPPHHSSSIHFAMFGRSSNSNMSQDGENLPPQPSMFAISQESMASQSQFSQSQFSQFSQDFAERMNGLAVHDVSSYQMMEGNDDSMCYSQSGNSGGIAAAKKEEESGNGGVAGSSSQGLSLSSAFKQQKQSQHSLPRSTLNFESGNHGPSGGLSINTNFGMPPQPPLTQDGSQGSGSTDRGTPLSAVGAPEMTFQVPVAREKKERDVSSSSSSGSGSSKNREGKSIDLPAPLDNPFLESTLEKKGDGNIKKHRRGAPQKIFVSAFKERSRYVWDFEQIDVLGEGQFSVVCYARKRLDGQMYAIKKLKTKITGDKGGALMTREAQAHAALNGCPNLTQYFNSWLDDHTLCIQTELCPYGSLESLVASLPLELASAKDSEEARDVNVSCDDPDATQDVDAMSDEDDDEQANNSFNYGTQNSQEDSAGNDLQESPPKSTAPTFAGVPEPVAWLVLSETARALAFMHAKEMVHLDIRPSNIFIASASGNENVSENGKLVRGIAPGQIVEWLLCGEAQLKVGDLGQCCRADEKNIQEGESRYCSRELINEDEKLLDLYKADVFSLGATVYELMLGRRLHAGEEGNNEWHSLRDGVFAAHLETGRYSPELLSTLRALMAPLPCNRPGAQAIVEQCREMSALQVHADVSKAVSPTASESQKMNSLLLELQQLRSENARLKGGEMN